MLKLIHGDNPLEIRPDDVVALDTETTGLSYTDRCLGISLAWRRGEEIRSCYMIPDSIPNQQLSLFTQVLGEVPESWLGSILTDCYIIGHNLAFDYRVLYREFQFAPPPRTYDTYYLAMMADWQSELNLEFLYIKYVGMVPAQVSAIKKHRSAMEKVPEDQRAEYGAWDAMATLQLFGKLREKVLKLANQGMLLRDRAFSSLVYAMIARGVPVNQDELKRRRTEYHKRIVEITRYFINKRLDNVGSDEQVATYLFKLRGLPTTGVKRTATGAYSVSVDELGRFAGDPEVAMVIEYRQLVKGLGSWVYDLQEGSSLDGRFHSILSPFGTRSFRMSSSQINMQAVPMEDRKNERGESRAFGSFKGVFKCQNPDEQLWALDLKQAEVRLAAMLASENNLARLLAAGGDTYTNMAIDTWNDRTRRQDAKRATLSAIYEVGYNAFVTKYDVSYDQAKQILDSFRAKFPGIKRESIGWETFAGKEQYVPLISGRRRWFEPVGEYYMAFNQRVQGGLAEIMDSVMLLVEQALPGRTLLQIHDSLILRLPTDLGTREPMLSVVADIVKSSIPGWLQKRTNPIVPMLMEAKLWE